MSEKTVFISYRRNPLGKAFAGRIFDSLKHHGYDVFLDGENLEAGDWKQQIFNEVINRGHFIMVLTPGSLTACSNPDDMVRFEFETALESHRNIVPVREESEKFSSYESTCPEPMKKLFSKQGLELRHNNFQVGITELIQKYLPPNKAKKPNTSLTLSTNPTINKNSKSSILSNFRKAILPFIDNFLTFLVVAAFAFALLNQGNGSSSYMIVVALILKGFVSSLSLSKEVRPIANVALVFVAIGSSILIRNFKAQRQFNNTESIIGFSTLAFGFGIATVVPRFKIQSN